MDKTKNISDIEIIKWAFEKGYRLATGDIKDGIHIEFSAVEEYFLHQLSEFYLQQNDEVAHNVLIE
jgi:hypothetical protein